MVESIKCLKTDVIFTDSFKELGYEIGNLGNNIVWVCDSNTARMVRPLPEPNVIIEPGENFKNLSNVLRIIETAIDNRFSSDCTFIAMGGGVVCDITSLAASLFMRGCHLVLIPTTVTAMSDACIGGANGVYHKFIKNVIGTKYPADKAFICIDCLKSLSDYEFSNGLAEIIKHSYLSNNEDLLKLLITKTNKILSRDPDVIRSIIEKSILVKKEIVESEDESMIHILSLGHNFAHSFESLSSLKCTHGQAVAWGVCKAMQLSEKLGLCSHSFTDSVIKLYNSYGYKTDYKINRSDWIEYSKKLLRNTITPEFIVLTDKGKFTYVTPDLDTIKNLVIKDARL